MSKYSERVAAGPQRVPGAVPDAIAQASSQKITSDRSIRVADIVLEGTAHLRNAQRLRAYQLAARSGTACLKGAKSFSRCSVLL